MKSLLSLIKISPSDMLVVITTRSNMVIKGREAGEVNLKSNSNSPVVFVLRGCKMELVSSMELQNFHATNSNSPVGRA